MKRMIAAVVGVALTGLMGSVGVLAQDKAAGSVYYGCLVPGSTNDSFKLIKASVPLSEMFQYVSTLRGMTKGRAQYSMQLEKYEVVPPNIQEKIVAASGGSKVAA